MVELMGVEPTAYTMRTCRSSQLSYSPLILFFNIACLSRFFKLLFENFGFFMLFYP